MNAVKYALGMCLALLGMSLSPVQASGGKVEGLVKAEMDLGDTASLQRGAQVADVGRALAARPRADRVLAQPGIERHLFARQPPLLDLADKAMDSEYGQQAKKVWQTPLGRNVGVGTAAGAALGLVILKPLIGAVVGGGIGYLATLAKKSKKN